MGKPMELSLIMGAVVFNGHETQKLTDSPEQLYCLPNKIPTKTVPVTLNIRPNTKKLELLTMKITSATPNFNANGRYTGTDNGKTKADCGKVSTDSGKAGTVSAKAGADCGKVWTDSGKVWTVTAKAGTNSRKTTTAAKKLGPHREKTREITINIIPITTAFLTLRSKILNYSAVLNIKSIEQEDQYVDFSENNYTPGNALKMEL